MTDKELIGKIKELKKIQPSQEWLGLSRHNLITQISFREEEDEGLKSRFGLFNWLRHPQSLALAVCLLLIFIVGPWLTLKASQPSLPGDLLYSVKKMSEGVQTTVTAENNKAQLQAEFASRRLEELVKITNDSFTPEEKTEKAKQVMSDFKGNLAGISQYVSIVSKEEAVAVAKKTKKIKEELDRTKEDASLETKKDLAEAEKAIEIINHQILAVLIGESQEGIEGTASTTPDQEVLIWIEEAGLETITTTEEILEGVE